MKRSHSQMDSPPRSSWYAIFSRSQCKASNVPNANDILIAEKKHSRGPGLIDFDNAVVFLVTHEALPNDPLTVRVIRCSILPAHKLSTIVQGTLPFMSAELLKESPYYADEDAPEPPVHSFKHDLESFLWVLVWVCLTREGPGERRHDLMSVEQTQPLLRQNPSHPRCSPTDPGERRAPQLYIRHFRPAERSHL
ncbi:uncharacterized protein C8Q71DRAFT_749998 [Rhodofomes roseus]|uniref:Fungal-type protein kinase domain-containing protein n=1 Tax=Rhodofomes roseus TaxID=34475 RepID=A0ABQ8KNV0_9APHY|nr:uncharacterized protein C8Q71DRAFT_749998 [Rhodofomes roseus]KAH9839540.1 hypothetical protein C8Q71DRAFT_749998 [Rhodofomes roseus]